MRSFWKNPKFIIGVIICLWIAYVIWANYQQVNFVTFSLLPGVDISFHISTIVIGAAIVGCILTLAIQFLWSRRSKKAAVSAPASSSSSKTVA